MDPKHVELCAVCARKATAWLTTTDGLELEPRCAEHGGTPSAPPALELDAERECVDEVER